jgi:LuxR family maltose regulon positive regulatory protein
MLDAAMTTQDPAVLGQEASGSVVIDQRPAIAEASPPVILSKVRIPRQRSATLDRGRLLGWLEQRATDRVVVVVADVGYGKSTLLADYARRSGARCAWYRVEESDGDWISFIGHLVAAIRVARPGFGTSSEALLRHVAAVGPSREIVTSSLLAEIGDLPSERTLVVLDDFHLVDGSDDVRSIMRRLLENAPEDWHFVLAARGRPVLPLGRLAGQGVVAELSTQDLRFTRAEVGELFDVHRHQLSGDVLDLVHDRTQGWAASLQLVLASVAASRPDEIEAFITQLSGARGPIHDFLAQEVLGRLDVTMQQVVTHASLLDRVTPALVVAALSETSDPIDLPTATVCLVEAERLGLLVTSDDSGSGSRFHPLLRDFLSHRLHGSTPLQRIAAMHVAIARAAESDDWLASGGHYALGGEPDEAMRVLGAAAYKALGTGAWGAASAVVDSTAGATRPPAVEVIRARALIAEGRASEALDILAQLESRNLDEHDLPLLGITRSTALHTLGRISELAEEASRISQVAPRGSIPDLVGRAWGHMVEAFRGGPIGPARLTYRELAAAATALGMHHFAGIALHNEATAALAQADLASAKATAAQAMQELLVSRSGVLPSAMMTEAIAALELGDIRNGNRLAVEAAAAADAQPDVWADGAYLAAFHGDLDRATELALRIRRALADGPPPALRVHASFAELALLQVMGQHREAMKHALGLVETAHHDLDHATRAAFMLANLSIVVNSRDARHRLKEARAICDKQQAWRWQHRLRILDCVIASDQAALRRELAIAAPASELAILETADAMAPTIDEMDPIPDEIMRSVARHPARWLPILASQLVTSRRLGGTSCAKLLAEYGTLDQLAPLVEYERASGARSRRRPYSKELVRRASPTMRIHDLGRTWYEIAGRSLRSSDSRRKASTLLLYLVTRPKQTATREQIMDDLWPDHSPDAALNSLHQTLHFVRRDIAPWVDEGVTADYVPMGLELVYLDPDLVQVDSVAFLRQATAAIASHDLAQKGPELFRLYTGRFAPEFEYEEWAADWRALVHTTFLHLAHATASALSAEGRPARSAEILTRALEVDPTAFNMHVSLVRILAMLGGKDAAAQQYRRFEAIVQRDLGLSPPALDDLLEGEELPDLE